jgi:aldehyde:ferredoxin oxidoreductase
MFGFAGKIVRVNLTNGSVKEEVFDQAMARNQIGGRGIGAKILFTELAPGVDPLGPENKLVFTGGLLTATTVPGNTRWFVMGKSPLTGVYGESTCSGSFGKELKRAGYDALIIEGASDHPVFLWIKDGKVEIRDAGEIWGKETAETEDAIKAELGDNRAWIACIGPAGEKLVKIAAIISDKHRAAARTGMATVMGSKKLKAIAVRGTGKISIAHPDRVKVFTGEYVKEREVDPGCINFTKYGTSGGVPVLQNQGILPTKGWQRGTFEGFDKISGQALAQSYLTKTLHCEGCNVPHDRQVDVKETPYGPIRGEYGGAEYETVSGYGSLLLIDDLLAINAANQYSNAMGIDTLSASNIVAWVIECYEKGILSKEDLGGLEPKWGDPNTLHSVLGMVANREGLGDLLAEGLRTASQKIGKGSEDFAVHVRGLEAAMHEPRGKKGTMLIYTAAGPRGAAHMEAAQDPAFERPNAVPELGIVNPVSRFVVDEKGWIIKRAADLRTLVNALGMCTFMMEPAFNRSTVTRMIEIINHVTGWETTVEEMIQTAERANNLARAFTVREGSDRRGDTLPKRFQDPLPEGASAGYSISQEEMDKMLDDFYVEAGWTRQGVPGKAKLESLGLAYVVEELERNGYRTTESFGCCG